MIDINLKISTNQLSFLSGFFIGQCYSKEREDRKAAIENVGKLYNLLSDEGRQQFAIVQERIEALEQDEDLKNEIAEKLNNLLQKFEGND